MKHRTEILAALLLLAGVGLILWLLHLRAPPHQSGALVHEAYVWQRAWTGPVRTAVTQHHKGFRQLVVLAGEVSWQDKQPAVARVALDAASLRALGKPVGLALRIGPYPGPFAGDDAIAVYLGDLAAAVVARARTNQIALSELQLDFDCATSKLDGYRLWVEAVARQVAPLPVTITALPSWLNAPAFQRLAETAPNYVLQVHSVERPAGWDAPFTLCDPRDAQRAVERAARLGVPFRVALPTYGYLFAFDPAGRFIGLSAEGPRKTWPEGTRLREVNSDPVELAGLVQAWTADRPAAMRGVIWYRLPTTQDTLNWRWPTLAAVMAGRSPRENLRAGTRRIEAGLVEVTLENDGELDVSSRLAVAVRWANARLVTGQATNGFELAEQAAAGARFQTASTPFRLRAGERLSVGLLRLDRESAVQCDVRRL